MMDLVKKMRGLLLCGIALAFALNAAEPLAVQVSLDDAATVGAELPVNVTVNAEISADDVSLPEINGAKRLSGIVSQRFSSSYDSRRGSSVSTTMSFIIRPEREGELVIPPVSVKAGKRQGKSEPYRFNVLPSGAPITTADGQKLDAPQGTLEIFPARKLYAGETATMILHLVIPGKMRINGATSPEISGLGDVSFVTRRSGNQVETFRFTKPRVRNGIIQLDGSAEFRLLGAGKFTPSAAMVLNVVVPQKRRSFFDDDFFSPFSTARTVQRKVNFACKTPIEVLPLPPPPQGAYDLGLVGTWKTACRFGKDEAKTGEAVELILTASGSGGTENFRAPQLEFPGFRVYPPEVRRDGNEVSARYVMIPLRIGNTRLKFSAAAFDAEKGRYEVTTFDLAFSVLPGSVSTAAEALPKQGTLGGQEESSAPGDALNYQKPGAGNWVAVPLIANGFTAFAVILTAGILLFAVLLLHRFFRRTPEGEARRAQRLQLEAIRRALKRGGEAEEVFRQCGVSAVAEALGLAPGATAAEIAEKCQDDPVLQNFFAHLDASEFAPGSAGKLTEVERKRNCRALLRLLARIMVLPLFFALPQLGAEEFNAAFDCGDYKAAVTRYETELNARSGAVSADLLYNLGNAYYRAGDLPRARVTLERAERIAPRDLEIRANLSLVRSELQLSSAPRSRFAALRDRFRPDEYLVFAASMALALIVLFLLRRRIPLPVTAALAGFLLILFIFALGAAVSQARGRYAPGQAVLIGKSVELRALPAAGTSVVSRAAGGTDARIIEKRGGWVRVAAENGSGWIPADQCMELFPYGIF